MANDLCAGRGHLADSFAIVWVAEDDCTVDEGRVLRRELSGGVMDELTALTVALLATDDSKMPEDADCDGERTNNLP